MGCLSCNMEPKTGRAGRLGGLRLPGSRVHASRSDSASASQRGRAPALGAPRLFCVNTGGTEARQLGSGRFSPAARPRPPPPPPVGPAEDRRGVRPENWSRGSLGLGLEGCSEDRSAPGLCRASPRDRGRLSQQRLRPRGWHSTSGLRAYGHFSSLFMFPVESLKKNRGASFEFAFGREKICSFSAGQTRQTLVLSQPKPKPVFKASRLAAPRSCRCQREDRAQPPGPGRFALGAELGICEFSTPSTSKRGGHSPLLHHRAQAPGAPSTWARVGSQGPQMTRSLSQRSLRRGRGEGRSRGC